MAASISALANGIYKKYGIDADIRMGGPQQNPSQLLLGGRVDMIMSNSFEAIRYARRTCRSSASPRSSRRTRRS